MYCIKKISIGHSVYSDHSPVHLELLETAENVKGIGFWKLNTSLLKDKEYVDSINNILIEESSKPQSSNKGLKWDTMKMIIRGHTISYTSYKAKTRRKYEETVKSELRNLEDKMATDPDENTKMHYYTNIK
jgi:hypothetical protein